MTPPHDIRYLLQPIQEIKSRKGVPSSSKGQKHGERSDTHNFDRFQICLATCRTSSSSLRHENTYKDPLAKHCYVRHLSKSPQRRRRTVNSLNNNGDSPAVVVASSPVMTLLDPLSPECRPEYRPSNRSCPNIDCPAPVLALTRFPLFLS